MKTPNQSRIRAEQCKALAEYFRDEAITCAAYGFANLAPHYARRAIVASLIGMIHRNPHSRFLRETLYKTVQDIAYYNEVVWARRR